MRQGSGPLRVLSVVTLVSPTGEYGGPVRVAVNQAKALRDLGHEVTLTAAARGYDRPPEEIDGVPTRLFPARRLVPKTGFAGLGSPGLWRWLRRHVRDHDVVHVHGARDFVTLPAAMLAKRAGVPYVLQSHGMIDPSDNKLATPVDTVLTRPVLHGARRVLYLTEFERRGLEAVAGPGLRLAQLTNGVPAQAPRLTDQPRRVLFLARLAARKRPLAFVDAVRQVGPEHPEVEFVLAGPDEGEGPAVQAAVDQVRSAGTSISWVGPLAPEETGAQMQRASVYVLPAVDEPYPMAVLEAMGVGLPVVITRSCGLAGLVRASGSGLVVEETVDSLVEALRTLLADPIAADEMGQRGRAHMREHMTMEAIARQLESLYSG